MGENDTWNVILFIPKSPDFQGALNDALNREIQGLAKEYGISVQKLLAWAKEWLRRIRAGEIQIYSPIKIIPKNLEKMNFSGIILKQTQEVSQRALMVHDKI